MQAVNNPEDPSAGTRSVPFSRELFIEQEDFLENPSKKFFRLAPGRTVRLRYGYLVTCTDVLKNEKGEVVEIHCRYDPASLSGDSSGSPRAKATLHWVSVKHATPAEVRLYDRLFLVEDPTGDKDGGDFKSYLNPNSLEVVSTCRVEPSLAEATPGDRYQFERLGYFCVDLDSKPGALIFNRTVTLRDAWAKIVRSGSQ
jgi:glutaminyl-tRNA synthetase